MAELHVGQAFALRTLAAAAGVARPGDVVVVHEGVYAHGFRPPAGTTWQAAEGERPVIDGGWGGQPMTLQAASAAAVVIPC